MIIQDLFLYFAKFPKREGVKAIATMGASDFNEYATLLTALDMMPEHSLVPDIDNYVYGQTVEDLQERLGKLLGSWLMADYGEFTVKDSHGSLEVSQRIAVTVALKLRNNADMLERMIASDKALGMLRQVHAHIMADTETGTIDWMTREALADAELVPFVASELGSYGWTLMLDITAPDMLGTHDMMRQFIVHSS